MSVYQNPQAASEVLMGGPPTPEEQEISSRIMNEGLSNIMGQSAAPAPQTQPMAPMAPAQPPMMADMSQIPGARAMREEARGDWVLMNEGKKVPWNENTTWSDYLQEVFEKHGKGAVDKIIDQQLQNDAENPPETETEDPGLQVMETVPLTQEGIAAASPNPTPTLEAMFPTDPSGAPEGIMMMARGGVVHPNSTAAIGDSWGGSAIDQLLRDHYVAPAPAPVAGTASVDSETLDRSGALDKFRREFGREPRDIVELQEYIMSGGGVVTQAAAQGGIAAFAEGGYNAASDDAGAGPNNQDIMAGRTTLNSGGITFGDILGYAANIASTAISLGSKSTPLGWGVTIANAAFNPKSIANQVMSNKNPIPSPLRGIVPGLPTRDTIFGLNGDNPEPPATPVTPMTPLAGLVRSDPITPPQAPPSPMDSPSTMDPGSGSDPSPSTAGQDGGDMGQDDTLGEDDEMAEGGLVSFADGGLMQRSSPAGGIGGLREAPRMLSMHPLASRPPFLRLNDGQGAVSQINSAQQSLSGAERALSEVSQNMSEAQAGIGNNRSRFLGQLLANQLGGIGSLFGGMQQGGVSEQKPDFPFQPSTDPERSDPRTTGGFATPMVPPDFRYAEGGLNTSPAVSEEEFMSVMGQAAQDAGVSDKEMALVSEMAAQAAPANDNVMDQGIMQTVEAVDTEEEDLSGIGSLTEVSSKLAESGEEPLIHASAGEIVFDPNRLAENERSMLFAALEAAGIDPMTIMVGGEMPTNDVTGLPAAGIGSFIKKIFKPVKKVFKKVGKFVKKNAGTILGIAGAMTGNPWLAALGSGVGSLIEGKPLQNALISAGLSFAGSKWVGPYIGEKLGAVSSSLNTPIGQIPGAGNLPLVGKGITSATTAGVQSAALEKAMTEAAANSALTAAASNAGKDAIVDAAVKAAQSTAVTNAAGGALSSTVAQGAQTIGENVASDVISKSLTSVAQSYSPYAQQVLGEGIGGFLAQPASKVIGSGVAALGQQAIEPMVQTMISGVPAGEEEDVLSAWSQRYNYSPTPGQLYQFYTSEYTRPTTVPANQIIAGLPGYSSIAGVAGGGLISGVGGPKSDSNLARLSDGEFVMTAKAVENAGGGDRMTGARRMYAMMNQLERGAA
jgi:hypothetical protein